MSWYQEKIKPMLAVRGHPFNSPEFIYEIKWDGTRAIAFVDLKNERFRIQNRRLMEIAHRYPELDFLDFLNENAIIDGEIVVFDGKLPSFYLLQKRDHTDSRFKASILAKKFPANYFVFDVLYTESLGWTIGEKLIKRKEVLEKITSEAKRVALVDFISERGKDLYERTIKLGIEGIIAKKITSSYLIGKRSKFWIKMKKRRTLDCIIVGWLEGEGERRGFFGSLILALKSGNSLIHVGQVGTGFDLDFIEWFYRELLRIEVYEPYFQIERGVAHWCKPIYVCEVEYLELTSDLKLRAPVFLRLRSDKGPEDCLVETISS
ncbi:MAG: non-homologous end-joining DNA ligase [Archaeoglobaceae archaeon]|nr:non-homologous end-joining DNA ligase [Archaeoglobaceae archaeon]MDW7989588.1 non-homologous end-joining DNA ligase [Archaeoglobaceae archaeon]